MANVRQVLEQTRNGGSEVLVELDDAKHTKVWRPVSDFGGGGGGDGGGGGGFDPLSELSPGDALSYAKILGEGSAEYPVITPEQIASERTRVSGIYAPFYGAQRTHLQTVESAQKQEAQMTRTTIADNYDDALKQLREQYNRRGLFFSGQELNEEARTGRDKANALTRTDLALQQTLSEIGMKGAEITLQEQQAIESEIKNYISSQSQINEGVGKANAARMTADLATKLLEGIGGRLQTERSAAASEKAERLRLAQSSEERDFARLFGSYRGTPTMAAQNQDFNQSLALSREARAAELHPLRLQQLGLSISRAQASLSALRAGRGSDTDRELASAMILGGAAPYTTIISQLPQKERTAFNKQLYQDYVTSVQNKEQQSRVVPLSEFNDYLRTSQQQFKSQDPFQSSIDALIMGASGDSDIGYEEENFDFLDFE